MIYTLVKNLFKILFTIFLRLKVEGTENIPKDGPLVIASNHLSLLDPPVLGTAATRKVHFMAKEELFVPVLGTIYKILGAFRYAVAARTVLQSSMVLISWKAVRCWRFSLREHAARPASLVRLSRSADDGEQGEGNLSCPACIIGTDYKRHGRIWPKVTVRFGKPMPFPEDAVVNKEFLHAMTEELMQHIAKLQAGEDV